MRGEAVSYTHLRNKDATRPEKAHSPSLTERSEDTASLRACGAERSLLMLGLTSERSELAGVSEGA